MKKNTLVKEGFFSRFLVMLVLIAALALLPGLLPAGEAYAADIVAGGTCGAQGDNLTWTLDSDGLLTISGTGEMAGYTYTSFPWYNYRNNVKSIIVEVGVTSIGNNAFYNCYNITSVTLPDSMTGISNYAFYGCASLTRLTIPDGVIDIGNWAFCQCTGLTSITIHNGITNIGERAFSGCVSLNTLTLPDSLSFIGNNAFYGCENLADIYYGGTSSQWYNISFSEGNSPLAAAAKHFLLINDSFGDNLTCTLDENGILTISGSGEMPNYTYGAVSSIPWYAYRSSIVSVVFNGEITSIGDFSFYECSGLSDVSIPNGVNRIGDSAFRSCSGLTCVTIPDSVTSIGSGAFIVCANLTDVTIPDSVIEIGSAAFYHCLGLTSIVIPKGVTGILPGTFRYCSNLSEITIPDSVLNIGDAAFEGCFGLTDVYYGGSCDQWKQINIDINNSYLDNATIHFDDGIIARGSCGEDLTWTLDSDGLLNISGTGNMTEYDSFEAVPWNDYCESIISINIENGVTSISGYAFSNCTSLVDITLPDGITSIGDSAFFGCRALTNVTIPEGVTVIGSSAFANCSSLTSIRVPGSVTSIGLYAFAYCSSLTSAGPFGSGCNFEFGWTDVIPTDAFNYCSSLTEVTIPEGVTSIGSAAFYCCSGMKNISIPLSVTSIQYAAFGGCSSLTSINIPEGVTRIDTAVFWCCESLTSINIPDSVTSIGGWTFERCKSLTEITIPSSVTDIGDLAFMGCNSLTDLIIPDSVTSIGDSAFYDCENLTDVYYSGAAFQWTEIVIANGNEPLTNATIHFGAYGLTLDDRTNGAASVSGIESGKPYYGDVAFTVSCAKPYTVLYTVDGGDNYIRLTATGEGNSFNLNVMQDMTIVIELKGDINGDGKINNKDVTRLMRYIKYGDVDVEEAALDVNGDGVVNNKDVTRLMRYIKYGDVDIF